jgi:hypothetical protein
MSALSANCGVPVFFAELESAVSGVVTSGQVGEPVNVRVHCDVADDSADLAEAILAAATLADAALSLTETRWTVRRDPHDRLLNALGVDDRGRTALLSASRAASDQLSLTVFGNHGVARIEQACLADALPLGGSSACRDALQAAIRGVAP